MVAIDWLTRYQRFRRRAMERLDRPDGWLWFAQREAERRFPHPTITQVGPEDMFVSDRASHYFSAGVSALLAIRAGLERCDISTESVARVLDVPCGAGRVMRMINAFWPNAELAACDIDRAGVDFCSRAFGATPIYSQNPITDVTTDGGFDLVWVGSLLTHLDEPRWPEMLGWFRDQLRPGGALIFSTQGEGGMDVIANGGQYRLDPDRLDRAVTCYRENGFGYAEYREQSDYGISFATPERVQFHIDHVGGLRYVYTAERGWDGHQDVTTCVKSDV
jgi:2-polyprenyl-3-methyl-5-hydroxy-6-metoxy-1,4-benzoquinol methylase